MLKINQYARIAFELTLILAVVFLTLKIYRPVDPTKSIEAKIKSFEQRQFEDIPRWIMNSPCTPLNIDEHAEQELILKVFQTVPKWTTMKNAAFKYFGENHYRNIDINRTALLCPADDLFDNFAKLSTEASYWQGGGFPGDHDIEHIRVGRNLGPRDPQIIAVVAETAFAPRPILPDEPETPRDIRALARVTLAEFGAAALPWSEKAFQSIASDTELGTTAAQIAVTTHHTGALEKIANLMENMLKDHPTGPIPQKVWWRFYDLAYALAAAGTEAQPYIGPVQKIMGRTIESWAPPFGMLELPPSEMCQVLKLIGGDQATATMKSPACQKEH